MKKVFKQNGTKKASLNVLSTDNLALVPTYKQKKQSNINVFKRLTKTKDSLKEQSISQSISKPQIENKNHLALRHVLFDTSQAKPTGMLKVRSKSICEPAFSTFHARNYKRRPKSRMQLDSKSNYRLASAKESNLDVMFVPSSAASPHRTFSRINLQFKDNSFDRKLRVNLHNRRISTPATEFGFNNIPGSYNITLDNRVKPRYIFLINSDIESVHLENYKG